VADWKTLFDVIVVGANKPAFLTNAALSLFRVDRYTYIAALVTAQAYISMTLQQWGTAQYRGQAGHVQQLPYG
jgi:hypothetical protein